MVEERHMNVYKSKKRIIPKIFSSKDEAIKTDLHNNSKTIEIT